MGIARLAALSLLLTACTSAPLPASLPVSDPKDPGHAWSAWTAPVDGLSIRASLPELVHRGERVPVDLALRFDPSLLPPGARFFDARHVEDRVVLLFRNRDTGATAEVSDDNQEWILETPLQEGSPEGSDRAEPGWIPIENGPDRFLHIPFHLVWAWEALPPGNWEVGARLDVPPYGKNPILWSGTVTTPTLPVLVEEAPPRHLRVQVPTRLRIRTGAVLHTVEVGFGPIETEFVDLEPRNGFTLGASWGKDGNSMSTFWPSCWEGFAFDDYFDRLDRGDTDPLDQTYELEIFETAEVPGNPLVLMLGHGGYRTLWKRSFRVTATATEIEALRR